MNCRNCGLPIHEASWGDRAVLGYTWWVHVDTDEFPCRNSDGLLDLVDVAAPTDEDAAK